MKNAQQFRETLQGSTDERLAAVANKLGQYHAVEVDQDANSQQRLRLLRELGRLIFTAYAGFQQQALAQPLKVLYEESEVEHRALVAAVVQHEDQLPVDTTGMGEEARNGLLLLWRAFVTNTGNVRVKTGESPLFQQRMHAGVAKLLQEPQGQRLIRELSAPDPGAGRRVTLGSDFTAELMGTVREQGEGSEAIPLADLAKETEKTYEFKTANGIDASQYREYTGAANDAAAFNEWLEHTLDRPYFKWGNTVYKVGTRTGSYVRIVGSGTGTLVGENDTEVLAPEFITLGHELGHARRQLAGKTFSSFITPENFGITGVDSQLWHNSEELANISGVENVLRAEQGLARRRYHVGDLADVRKTKNFKAFDDSVFAVYDRIKGWTQTALKRTPLWQELENEMTAPQGDWTNNATVEAMQAKVDSLDTYLRVLHRIQLDQSSPDLIYESANAATRRKLDLDSDFGRYRLQFNTLLDHDTPEAFTGGAPELCNQMKHIAGRLTVEAATESSIELSRSAGDLPVF
jgi:hypothetical protein